MNSNTAPVQPPPMAASIAKKFVEAGGHVILFPRGTKRCTATNWQNLATNDLQTALALAQADPFANVGIVGKENGFWGLDDDGGLVKEYEAQYGPLQTYQTRTVSGGRHFIFRQSPASWAMGNVSIEDERGKELLSARVNNRYVVAAGSWAYPNNDESLPLTQYVAINPAAPFTEAPELLFDFIKAKAAQYKAKGKGPSTTQGDEPRLYLEGGRNNGLARLAGKLRKAGANEDEIFPVLTRLNEEQCVPPLPTSEVASIAKSIGKYPPGKDGTLELSQTAKGIPLEIIAEVLDKEFPAYDGTEPEELPMLIEGFMPKGVGFFGSLSGTGKTWCGLSIANALTSGRPLWSVFPVKRKVAVLYLIPEASDASFKRRLGKMKITQDKDLFRYRTITQGITRPLSDPVTVAMIQQLSVKHDVLVIVDTAVRFFRGGDENAAKENNLVQDSDMLRSIGANVLFLHHSPKATKDAAELTLENALRGTGDFGAMADFVYAFRRDEKAFAQGEGPEEIEVVCVKPRDFEPPLPFRLQLKRKAKQGEQGPTISVIDEMGDLGYIGNATVKNDHEKMLADVFHENPYVSFNDLCDLLKMKRELVRGFCKRNGGWKQVSEPALGARGKTVTRKKWTQGLVMAGQVEQTYTVESAQSGPTASLDAATLAMPGEDRPVHSMVTVEDVTVGF